MAFRLLLTLVMLASAAPAWAQDGVAVSDGSHITLFALGLVGLLIGRRAAMRDTEQD